MALPNTYYRLDYIQSSGTQCINTGIQTSTKRKLELGFALNSTSRSNIYGSGGSSSASYVLYSVRGGGDYPTFRFHQTPNTSPIDTGVSADTNRHDIVIDNVNGNVSFDGVTYQGYIPTGTTKYTEFIFGYNAIGTINNSYSLAGKVYYVKYYEDGVLVRDFIPAKRISDNVVGMYDLENDVFYTNAGSGSFTYGSIVYEVSATENPTDSGTILGTGIYSASSNVSLEAIPDLAFSFQKWTLNGYTKLDYIESSGTQYIDTGLKGNLNTVFEASVNKVTPSTNNTLTLFGDSTNSTIRIQFNITLGGSISRTSIFGNKNLTSTEAWISTNTDYVVKMNKTGLYVDDVLKGSFNATSSFTTDGTMYLFKSRNVDNIDYLNGTTRVYWAKIFDGATLVRHFIPVKRNSDSAIGMLDLVGMKFYANNGTGTFTYGEELGDVEFEDNPLTFNVTEDISFVANFQLNYTITLTYDNILGTASYTWSSGTTIDLSATPHQSCQFLGWYVNSVKISGNTTYTYTVLGDTTIEARFEPIHAVADSVNGQGAISYTRGTDQNDVTFTVIPDANWHFVKYVVDSTDEYTTTPLSLHLTDDTSITAYFEEDDKFDINTKTNIEYASIYVSASPVYSGTTVTLYARPMADYIFVSWEDGDISNPRQITVTENVLMVALYQRMPDDPNIQQYRCYVKDQLDLTDPPKAFLRVDSFTVKKDLMTNCNSTIRVMDTASNINNGDILVLYDPTGTTLYQGVIKSMEDKTITCSQMQSFYKGDWIYNVYSTASTLEEEFAYLLGQYAQGKMYGSSYTDGLVAQRLGGITIQYTGSTSSNLPADDVYKVMDMEKFIYSLYENYGIILDFEINFSGTNYVTIKVPSYQTVKVGNNMYAIKDMSPITTIEETNRLIIFAKDKTYKTTYVATTQGIVENPSTTANRFNITNTKIVFSDDPVADLVSANLPDNMYNHKLTFTLVVRNFIYEFGDFKLGGSLDVWYGEDYYNTVLTGYEIRKQTRQNITEVGFTCGLVRTALTKLMTLGRV